MLNGKLCAQWEIIMCSTGHYWGAQLDIIGVLNGKFCAQQEIIMCSTGHYWGAQWEVMCSTGNYCVLNWTLLGAHWEIRCSMGNYYVLNWTLFGCSTGSQVLNGKLCAQWEIIMCLAGHYWSPQWEVLDGKLMVCIL